MSKPCKSCGQSISEARLLIIPNTEHCVNCTSESRWSSVPIINHKTGNTIEVVKDPEVAAEFHKLSSRAGFGTLRGLRMGKSSTEKVKLTASVSTHSLYVTPEQIEEIGKRATDLWESLGQARAERWLTAKVEAGTITRLHADKIIRMIKVILQPKPEPVQTRINYNPKPATSHKGPVDEEIQLAFKHWKRF
jgi:hypothetical protein